MALGSPAVYPGVLSWLGVAREQTAGTPVTSVITHPVEQNQFEPEDVPRFLKDNAIRGAMTDLFYETLGVVSSTFSFGGPNFLDTHGYFMDNVFGDLSTTASSTVTVGTTSTVLAVGATSLTLAVAAPLTVGSSYQIGTALTTNIPASYYNEVITISNSVSTTAYGFVNTPLRFTHATGGVAGSQIVGIPTSPYTHRFAALNSYLGYGGAFGAQPPTHTFTDVTNIVATYTSLTYGTVASTGIGARQYPSGVLKNIDFSGNAEQLLNVRMAGDAFLSNLASTAPTLTVTNSRPVPNWNTTVYILGQQINQIGEFNYSFVRNTQVYWTMTGTQTPYIIARGPLNAQGSLQWDPTVSEQPLDMMLLNAQGPMTIVTTNNGITNAGQAFTISTVFSQAANIKSKIMRNKALIGYANSFEGVANSTDIGGSGGLGPGVITLVNTVPTY